MIRTERREKKQNGFIALITAIILSFILITVAVSLNQTGFFARSAVSDAEYKARSAALAEACFNQALLALTENPAYGGNETVAVDTDSCAIRPILFGTPALGQITIETRALFNDATTDLRIVIKASDHSIISWEEVPNF